MTDKLTLIGSRAVAGTVYDFWRGPDHPRLSIWIEDWEVAWFWGNELHQKVPNARFDPRFLKRIGHIRPWPGRMIQAAAIAAYRAVEQQPVVRVCEG